MFFSFVHLGGSYTVPELLAEELAKLATGTDMGALKAAIELEKMVDPNRLAEIRSAYIESRIGTNLAIVVELDRYLPRCDEDDARREVTGYPIRFPGKPTDIGDTARLAPPERDLEIHQDVVDEWTSALFKATAANGWTRLNRLSFRPLEPEEECEFFFIDAAVVAEWLRSLGLTLMAANLEKKLKDWEIITSTDSEWEKFFKNLNETTHQQPNGKTRNAYLRTIEAFVNALIKGRTGRPTTDARAALNALQCAGIENPIDERTLANYLTEADKLAD